MDSYHVYGIGNALVDLEYEVELEDLEALVAQIRDAGLAFLDEIETYPYGKFIHLLDPEGNKIELWEPLDPGFEV